MHRFTKTIATVGLGAVALSAFGAIPAQAAAPDRIGGPFVLHSSIPVEAPYFGVSNLVAVSGQVGENSLAWARGHASATTLPAVGQSGPVVISGQCLTSRASVQLTGCYSPDHAQSFTAVENAAGDIELQQTAASGEVRTLGYSLFTRQWTVRADHNERTVTTLLGSELAATDPGVPEDVVLPPISQAIWDEILRSENGWQVAVTAQADSTVEAYRGSTRVATAEPVARAAGTYRMTIPLEHSGADLTIRTTADNGQQSESTMRVPGASTIPAPRVTWVTTDGGDFVVRGFAETGSTVMADDDADRGIASTHASNGRFELRIPQSYGGQRVTYSASSSWGESARVSSELTTMGESHIPATAPAPRVHGVASHGSSTLFVEGTVEYHPDQWASTNVMATAEDGTPLGRAAEFNGAFAVAVPASLAGQRITLVTEIGNRWSEETTVIADPSENDAAGSFPLGVTSPAAEETVTTSSPTFSGSGIPGSAITVAAGTATDVCETSVGADGTWSCTPTGPLADGTHTASVTEVAYWSSVAPSTTTRTFAVDTSPEEHTFAVTAPTANGDITGRSGVAGYPNAAVTVTGTGTPNASVAVYATNGRLAGTTTTNERGEFSVDADFNWARYDMRFVQTVDGTDSSITVKNVTVVKEQHAFTVTAPTADGEITGRSGVAGYPNAAVTVTGTGTPNASVAVYATNGRLAGTTTTNERGEFSVDADFNWARYDMRFVQTVDGTDSSITVKNVTVVR